MRCSISLVSAFHGQPREGKHLVLDLMTWVVASSILPPTRTTGLFRWLCPIRSTLHNVFSAQLGKFQPFRRNNRWRRMRLVLVSAWIDSCSVPGKVYIDPPKFCSHPEHSVYKDVGILAKRNARWLSKCHHRRLAVNEQATRLINCDIYRHFYLSQLFFCHQTGLDLWPSRKIKPTLRCSFKSSYWTHSTIEPVIVAARGFVEATTVKSSVPELGVSSRRADNVEADTRLVLHPCSYGHDGSVSDNRL